MYAIDHATAVAVKPAAQPAGTAGWFSDAQPGDGVPTVVTYDFLNNIQHELLNVLDAAGIAPNKAVANQLLLSIQSLVGASAVVGAGAIHGLTLSPAVGNPTTRMTASIGLTRDSTNTAGGILGAPMTKRLDQPWAAGDGNGGLLSGVLTNGATVHCFAIINPTTGAMEAPCFDLSPTAPALVASGAAAAGFTKFRRLGSIPLEASSTALRQFTQDGDYFEYLVRSADYAVQANGGGVPYLRNIATPFGIRVRARLYYQSTGTANTLAYLSGCFDPNKGVPAAFGGPSQRATLRRIAAYQQAAAADLSYGTYDGAVCWTDTSARVYTFSNDNSDVIALGVIGWEDFRGRFF